MFAPGLDFRRAAMTRRLDVNRCALSILFPLIFAAGMAHGDDGSVLPLRFDATLGGIEAVPGPVDTLMSGRTDFLFNPEETAAQFSLTLANGANITEARLHCGPRGAAGPQSFRW